MDRDGIVQWESKYIHGPGEHSTLAGVDQGWWGDRRCVEQSQEAGSGERLDMHTVVVLPNPWRSRCPQGKYEDR
jgi:hypothetical protein